MNDENDWIHIADHLAGRTSLAERAALARWIAAAPERQRLVDGLERVWKRAAEIGEPITDVDARAAWRELSARLEREAQSPAHKTSRGRRRSTRWAGVFGAGNSRARWTSIFAAAAAVAMLAAGGVILSRRIGTSAPRDEQQVAVREVLTASGQRAELHLDDGSRVVLGVASKLRWPTTFGAHTREVALEGEALFIVTHDATRPFVVRSANAVIRDLGTEFGVRAYAGDQTVRVVVRSGSVALAPTSDSLTHRAVLEAGDMGSLAADGALRVEHGVDVRENLSFAEGHLELVDAPMPEVARQLERWYGVRLVVDDTSLAHATVSASFGADEELSTVVRTLAGALGAHAEQHGRIVRLSPVQ
jgi:ferric-dicitrate binding protein FerR (iron transport regulator)